MKITSEIAFKNEEVEEALKELYLKSLPIPDGYHLDAIDYYGNWRVVLVKNEEPKLPAIPATPDQHQIKGE